MTSLRERRREHTLATIVKQTEKRDQILAQLCRVQAKLVELHRQRERYERAETGLIKSLVKSQATLPQSIENNRAIAEARKVEDDCEIPAFLQRKRDSEARDKIAADAIRAEQEERKRNKTRVRIEEMKAKKAGKTKQMPLQGKDALKAIYG